MGSVICPGEALIDFICTDKGMSLVDSLNFIKKPGGAPANVAVAIQKMGAKSYFLGSISTDAFGQFLMQTLRSYQIDCSFVKYTDIPTTLAYVSLMEDGDRDFYFVRGADENYVLDSNTLNAIHDINVAHFGSATAFLGGNLQKSYYDILDYAVKSNIVISFDPNYRQLLFRDDAQKEIFIKHSMHFIEKSHIVKVSEEEACMLADTKDIDVAAHLLLSKGAKFLIVSQGKKGATLYNADKKELIPSVPVKMVDATGAGDAFIGCIIAQVANNCSEVSSLTFEKLKEFISLANKVGALTVQRYGGLEAVPYLKDL